MDHLSEIELEELIADGSGDAGHIHLTGCALCRERLAEKRAIARRLRDAFEGIHAPASLGARIGLAGRASDRLEDGAVRQATQQRGAGRRSLAAAISAAAALIVAIPLLFYLTTPSTAIADLANIHSHNLSESGGFISETDPEMLAAYFKEHLGFNPRLPEPNHGLRLRGCCVRHFQGDIAGSYVVATADGIMSIIVVRRAPQSMGMTERIDRGGHAYWRSAFATSNMVSVKIGDYSYCAVGEISHGYLEDLLSSLLEQ